jgi:hypothetical protein
MNARTTTINRTCVLLVAASLSCLAADPLAAEQSKTAAAHASLSVESLVDSFPADKPATRDALCKQILGLGPAGVSAVLARVLPPGQDDTKARYAVNGIVVYSGRAGATAERALVANALLAAVAGATNDDVATFYLSQLRLVAGRDLIRPLQSRLLNERLAAPTAAVLVTVGGVATAVQFVSGPGNEDSGAVSDLQAESDTERSNEDAAPGAADEEETPMSGAETEDETAAGITDVETFASGSDYSAGTDLLAALRELGADTASSEVPAELTELAAGGEFWKNCEEAIAKEYASLLVAVDFAHYESQPAIVALMVGESGDIAVALTPACADGVIEPLAKQP